MYDETLSTILENFNGTSRAHLIPLLQEIQENLGYLSREAIARVGQHLGLPASKVYGVATFYNQFRFQPIGRYHILVCRGTACHVKGSSAVLEALKRILKIEPGQTSKDGLFSLEVVACIGVCGLAPVISVNETIHAGVTPDALHGILDACRKEAKAHDERA